jgi:hypothetical protein
MLKEFSPQRHREHRGFFAFWMSRREAAKSYYLPQLFTSRFSLAGLSGK